MRRWTAAAAAALLGAALWTGCRYGGDPGGGGVGGMTNGPGDQTTPGPTGSGRDMPGGNVGGGQSETEPSAASPANTPR